MRSALILAGLATLTVGCAKPIEIAEGDCPELLKQAFRDVEFTDEESETAFQSILLGLDVECVVNLGEDADDRVINPGPLTEEYLGSVPVTQGDEENPIVLTEQTPVGLPYNSTHDLATHVAGMADTNQNCLGSDSTRYSQRTFTEGGDCFFDGTCDKAVASTRNFTKNAIAKIWMDGTSDFYRTTIPFESGDVEAIVSRGWIDTLFYSGHDGDGGSVWKQRYVLDVYYEDPEDSGRTKRYYMYWAEAEIVGLGDDFFVSQVIDGLQENFENVDAFFDGEICDDRDLTEADVRDQL